MPDPDQAILLTRIGLTLLTVWSLYTTKKVMPNRYEYYTLTIFVVIGWLSLSLALTSLEGLKP